MIDASSACQEHVPTERDAFVDVPASERERPFLLVRVDDRTRAVEIAEDAEVLVGRVEDADIVVAHPSVSRRHAVFRLRRGALSVEDLGTVNGTRVNRLAITGAVKSIAPGDFISVGPAEIVVAMTAKPRAPDAMGSDRLERELERASASDGIVLVRLGDDAASRAALLDLRDDVLASDAKAAGEIVALLTAAGHAALRNHFATRSEIASGAAFARFPADGATIAELVAAARAAADDEPIDTGASVLVADPAMIKVFQLARRVASTKMNVLLSGETGVGKEIVAEHIHATSSRRGAPFVRLNCGAIPDALLESELFGHERGAFTGASRRRIGYFEAAGEGTLFLDEIGELSLALQAKLLRVLETRKLTRLGSTEEIEIGARLLFATHKDLRAEVAKKTFREDLFYRISTFNVRVPPLRERPTEIALLAEHFARRFAADAGAPPVAFDKTATTALKNYPWPGNVRELKNAVEHAVVMSSAGVVHARDLPEAIVAGPREIPKRAIRTAIEELERDRIVEALAAEGGNRTYAARRLGMSRRALLYKIAKHGLGRG